MNRFQATNSWKQERLGTVCKVIGGYAFKSADYRRDGVPVIKIGNIKDGRVVVNDGNDCLPPDWLAYNSLQKYILKPGDVLIALTGATTGKVGIVSEGFPVSFLNQRVGRISPCSKDVDLHFVANVIQRESFQARIKQAILKSAQGNVSPSSVEEIEVPLPPFEEQRAIACALRAVQEAKKARQQELALERECKAAFIQYLFTHGTRGEPRKQTEIGEIPESWQVLSLGQIRRCRVRTSFPSFNTIEKLDTGVETDELVLALKVSDMNLEGNSKYLKNSVLSFRHAKGDGLTSFLPPGSIVFPKRGAAIATNKKRITSTYSILDPNLIGVAVNAGIDNEYLLGFFEKLDLRSLQDNNPIPQLNKNDVERLLIPLPEPTEQHEISELLRRSHSKATALENEISLLQELFSTMLEELMTGRLSAVPLIEAQGAA